MQTTDAADILSELQARGVRFTVADDRLRWTPRDAVRPDEIDLLRRFKPDLIRLVSHTPDFSTDPPGDGDRFAHFQL